MNKLYDINELGLKIEGYSDRYEVIVKCPYHNDTNPSACFNLQKGLFYCFSCGMAKNVEQLARDVDGQVTLIDGNRAVTGSLLKEKLWRKLLLNPIAINNKYLLARGVTNDQIKRHEIRENKRSIIFPLYDANGVVVGVQLRNYTAKPKYITFGTKPSIWPMQERKYGKIFLTEGIFGQMALERWGYSAYATLGAMVKRDVSNYLNDKNVIGVYDNDFAGYVACGRTLKFLPRARVMIPGVDLDKISKKEIELKLENDEMTNNIGTLAIFVGDTDKQKEFWSRIGYHGKTD